MPRPSYAMTTFVSELLAVRHKAKVELIDPDGFGTFRTVLVDAKTADWLVPVLQAVRDPRITQHGRRIEFTTHPREGESRESFSLAEVVDVLYPPKKK